MSNHIQTFFFSLSSIFCYQFCLNQGTYAFPLGKASLSLYIYTHICTHTYICAHTYILKVVFSLCLQSRQMAILFFKATKDYTHTHIHAEFLICNENEPLTLHFSILFQCSLKCPISYIVHLYKLNIRVLTFLFIVAEIKQLVKSASIIFCNFSLSNYLLK